MAKVYTAQEMREMEPFAVVVKMTQYGPVKETEKTNDLKAMLRQAADSLERENKEIDELKKQVSIAKDAFFNIARHNHLAEVHAILCDAEFMMNHPECREAVTK